MYNVTNYVLITKQWSKKCNIQDVPPSCCLRSNAVVVSMMCRHLVVDVETPHLLALVTVLRLACNEVTP
jgi:hypothetical protein